MRRLLFALAIILGLGCEHRTHPWEQPDASASATSAITPPPPPLPRPTLADAGESADAAAPEQPEAPTPPVRVGGPWVRCYGGFHPSGDPVKDLTRLSFLCGPENGMKRLSKQPLEGTLREGGPAVTDTFDARRGECYRVFAVAEPAIVDLDVVVRSSRGAAVAADHGEDAWPIVQPDRPFCPLEDDRYAVEVTAKRGNGRFAAEVWVLRTPGPKRP
ncbi:MAG: hypothetical protein QM820_48350 [Minicystis sp.]